MALVVMNSVIARAGGAQGSNQCHILVECLFETKYEEAQGRGELRKRGVNDKCGSAMP